MPPDDELLARLESAWRDALRRLKVEATIPAWLEGPKGAVRAVAVIPRFGREAGLVLFPTFGGKLTIDRRAVVAAEKRGMHWSFINVEFYVGSDLDRYVELLTDCGYFGPPEERPAWLAPA